MQEMRKSEMILIPVACCDNTYFNAVFLVVRGRNSDSTALDSNIAAVNNTGIAT